MNLKTVSYTHLDVYKRQFLYHGTIKSNIAMYQDISDEQVKDAATFVDADSFIQELPQGYDSPVSERGSSFSTGQRLSLIHISPTRNFLLVKGR